MRDFFIGDVLLVALPLAAQDTATLDQWLRGRIYVPLFLYQSQGLEVYKVYPAQ